MYDVMGYACEERVPHVCIDVSVVVAAVYTHDAVTDSFWGVCGNGLNFK